MNKITLIIVSLVLVLVAGLAGCGGGEPGPFIIQVIPEKMEDTIAGQSCVFLVTVCEGEGGGQGGIVNISATAPGATVTVGPQAITPEQVAEVIVVPDEASIGSTLTVIVNGERDGLKQIEIVTLYVLEDIYDSEGLATYAIELHGKFIPWLAENHPELGITGQTEWTGTIVTPHIMEVMYYLFFSEDWEMGLRWHVTIPPYDWVEIYLRHRTIEVAPSYAFKISSLEAQDEPQAVSPEASVWR